MEEKGGSATTELLICNCGKPSTVQISIKVYEGRNLYENKSIRM